MFLFEENNIQWLALLLLTIIVSIGGVSIPNRFKQLKYPRSHNNVKLVTESLARHQLAYFVYFFTWVIEAEFDPNLNYVRTLAGVFMFLSVLFYVEAQYSALGQDELIGTHHECTVSDCQQRIPLRILFRLWVTSLFFALILLSTGIFYALLIQPRTCDC